MNTTTNTQTSKCEHVFDSELVEPVCWNCGEPMLPTPTTDSKNSTTTSSIDWDDRDKVAAVLTPLIKQIFHGENYTSDKIHEEMDKALDGIVALLSKRESEVREEERDRTLDEFKFIREESELHIADDVLESMILQATCSHDSFYWARLDKTKCICEQCFKVLETATIHPGDSSK